MALKSFVFCPSIFCPSVLSPHPPQATYRHINSVSRYTLCPFWILLYLYHQNIGTEKNKTVNKVMAGLGVPELILIVAGILLLFGGSKVPELMRGLGRGVKGFNDTKNDAKPTPKP
jgi:sec-independent protein translocase protein TatA